MFRFQGMMAPTFTPMKGDGSLNVDIIPSYAQYLYSRGVKGVYVAGTTGEGLSLTVPERKLLTEAWMKVSSDCHLQVIAMVGAVALKDTQDLAKHAEGVGVSGIATLPNIYNKPSTVEDLVDYCMDVASAAPKTPLFYYHVPFMTGIDLQMDEFLKIGESKIKTLNGLKFTSHEIASEGLKCLHMSSGKFTIFSGFDEKLCEALMLGYKCAINCCFNFLGAEAKEIFHYVEEGERAKDEEKKDWQQMAKKQQDKINEIMKAVLFDGFNISALKSTMIFLTGIDVGPTRKPLKPLSSEEFQRMSKKLASLM